MLEPECARTMISEIIIDYATARRQDEPCSATIRMVAGDNQDGYLRHRLKA
jgi:hypothetical protein